MRTELHEFSLSTQVQLANKKSGDPIYHVDSLTGKRLEIGTTKIIKKGKIINEVSITLKNPGFIESDDLKAYLNGYLRISPTVSLNLGSGYKAEEYAHLIMDNEEFRESIMKQHGQEFQSNSNLSSNFIVRIFSHLLGKDNVLIFKKIDKPTLSPMIEVNYGTALAFDPPDLGNLLDEQSDVDNLPDEAGNERNREKLFLDYDELKHGLKQETIDNLLRMLNPMKVIDIKIPDSCSYEGTGETGIKALNSAMGVSLVLKHFFTEDEVLLKIIESLLSAEKRVEIKSENHIDSGSNPPIELNPRPWNNDKILVIYINDFQDTYYKKILFTIVESFIEKGTDISLIFGENLDINEFKEFINKANFIDDKQMSVDYSNVNLNDINSKIKITFVDSLKVQE